MVYWNGTVKSVLEVDFADALPLLDITDVLLFPPTPELLVEILPLLPPPPPPPELDCTDTRPTFPFDCTLSRPLPPE